MELKINRLPTKTKITTDDKQLLFIIKNKSLFNTEKIILKPDGTAAYSIKRDPKPLDSRDKYIFTDLTSKNEFYAWVDCKLYNRGRKIPIYRQFLFSKLEFYIDAESFFGEICIERIGLSKFDILINGKKRGRITRKSISCEDIDDTALLCVLYALTNYISASEDNIRTENAI